MFSKLNVLVADDDSIICRFLQKSLARLSHQSECVHLAEDAVRAVQKKRFDLVLLDIGFPDCRDLTTLKRIREASPETDVIIVTAEVDDLEVVTEAVQLGAFDYIPKPVREDDILIRITRLAQKRELENRQSRYIGELARGRELDDIVGDSLELRTIKRRIAEFAPLDMPALIVGETGTGKELVARALHYSGPRRDRPFVSINCAAIPKDLTESELFGHEKGAFTGASSPRKGAFEQAEDGTLLLDEIGDMNLLAQAALLHVLESGVYRSIGGVEKTASARIVVATNQDFKSLISQGRFRKDLYYRIDRLRLDIPPLRQRPSDIEMLADHFRERMDRKMAKGVKGLDPDALAALKAYDWPGNVRELKNEIERAYLNAEGDSIQAADLSSDLLTACVRLGFADQVDDRASHDLRRLVDALKETGGNLTRAASLLGVHRNTALRWMKKHSIDRERA